MMFSVLETGHSADLKLKVEGALNHGEETIFSILAGGIVEKEFPPLAEPRLVATMIHKALIGSMMDLYLRTGVKKAADYEKAILNYVSLLLEKSTP